MSASVRVVSLMLIQKSHFRSSTFRSSFFQATFRTSMADFSDRQLHTHRCADDGLLATRAIRHTNEIQPGDVARILCAVSKNMLPLLVHCYSPPNALWYRDHHYQKYGSYRNNSAVCKDRGCLCCKQKKKGLYETHCEYCLGAHVLSTVNKETSRVAKTYDRVWNWWVDYTYIHTYIRTDIQHVVLHLHCTIHDTEMRKIVSCRALMA